MGITGIHSEHVSEYYSNADCNRAGLARLMTLSTLVPMDFGLRVLTFDSSRVHSTVCAEFEVGRCVDNTADCQEMQSTRGMIRTLRIKHYKKGIAAELPSYFSALCVLAI